MPTFHRRIYWLLPTANNAAGRGSAGDVNCTTVGDSAGSEGAGGDLQNGEGAAGVGGSGTGAKTGAPDTSNFVLVHYLDERHIVSDPSDPSRFVCVKAAVQSHGRVLCGSCRSSASWCDQML